jgi:hypothetical protein
MTTVTTKKSFNITDAQEIVGYIHHFQDVLDKHAPNMNDGAYLELCDTMMGLYCLDFYVELEIAAGKTPKIGAGVRRDAAVIRKLAITRPDLAIICGRCNTALMIKSYEKHLKSKKCRDHYYTLKAGDVCEPCDTLNEKVIAHYDNDLELPDIEILPEHQFHIGGASGLDD